MLTMLMNSGFLVCDRQDLYRRAGELKGKDDTPSGRRQS